MLHHLEEAQACPTESVQQYDRTDSTFQVFLTTMSWEEHRVNVMRLVLVKVVDGHVRDLWLEW